MPTFQEHFEQTRFESALADLPKRNEDMCCPHCGESPTHTQGMSGDHVVYCDGCGTFGEGPRAVAGYYAGEPAVWREYRFAVAAYIAEHGDRFGQCVRGPDVPGALATIGATLGSLVLFVALMIGAAALLLALSAHVMGAFQ